MVFNKEAEFEEAVIKELTKKGWEENIIKYPTEEDLIQNWADILFENNRGIDRLNDVPLSKTEIKQILDKIEELKTPLKLNSFINSKTISIKRDNPDDKEHYGKEISLKIYDRQEIAAGQSRYQIVQQPIFKNKHHILPSRRGDIMLLINGMPVIHIELKKSEIPVSQAYNQIKKYSDEGIFSGIFSLIQIFVAMTPEESVYFANPGSDGIFNPNFYFHWADVNNEPINEWNKVIDTLLSIPMAHQLIGFYTIADESEGILKVMRSYQYFAVTAISDKVLKHNWKIKNPLAGYIWHTTGSGKTMTSFKSAQLISASKNADKVIFLMDRIELGVQSLREYRGFAGENEDVQATQNTNELITKLKSDNPANTLIVTSIQKMSNINKNELKLSDIEKINSKRIVFIIDEAHRSTFGDMLVTIKDTFDSALFFGFTGTPIHEENSKKKNTTTTIFGDELHRYTIADGIRDKNVLGFDLYKILTYKDRDVREAVALYKAKAKTREEALNDPNKKKIYLKYMNEIKMAGYKDEKGKYIKGIEDELPKSQYSHLEYKKKVVEDILENFPISSQNKKFHAIFATTNIPDAIKYYRLFKNENHDLKITALFDPNIDNGGEVKFKEDGLIEIFEDYNKRYEQKFNLSSFSKFKKDIGARLAHKEPYIGIEKTPEQQIDILIVVDQMLTGFDSKWLNTLYLDKLLKYENIIQSFSRTNRLFGFDKPFGIIRYYKYPHTMEQNIKEAVKLYSGDKSIGLFVDKLEKNLNKLNSIFEDIKEIFENAGIENFSSLPIDKNEKAKFAKLFKEFNEFLEAVKLQGFKWDKLEYEFEKNKVILKFDKTKYLTLLQRYKELSTKSGDGDGGDGGDAGDYFDIDTYLTEIDTGVIDDNYMNSRFQKYIKILQQNIDEKELEKTLNELYKSFAFLSQEEQKFAQLFLHDVQRGDIVIDKNKTFKDYIIEYLANFQNNQIEKICKIFGIDKNKLENMLKSNITEENINVFGRFDDLKKDIDWQKAKEYFEKKENKKLPIPKIKIKTHQLLKNFIINKEFEKLK